MSKFAKRISFEDRKMIQRMIKYDESARAISIAIDIHEDTVRKEIIKNGGRELYDAVEADKAVIERRKQANLVTTAKRKETYLPTTKIGMLQRRVEALEETIKVLEMHIELLTDLIKEKK